MPQEHWQRIVLNDDVTAHLDALGPEQLRAAEISGDTHAGRGWKEYTSLMYPEFDLCEPIADPGRFDVVICEQVLEHVPDPFLAASNLRELCVPGGHVIVSTPFLVRVHELQLLYDMRDYWRFTPRGLRTLLERGGLEVDEVGVLGQPRLRGRQLRQLARLPPLALAAQRARSPVQVWAFARRPDSCGTRAPRRSAVPRG